MIRPARSSVNLRREPGRTRPSSASTLSRAASDALRRVWASSSASLALLLLDDLGRGPARRTPSLPSLARIAGESASRGRPSDLRSRASSASLSIRPSSGRMISASPRTATAHSCGPVGLGGDGQGLGVGQGLDERLARPEDRGDRPVGQDDRADLGLVGDVPLGPEVPDRGDLLLPLGDDRLGLGVAPGLGIARPGGDADALGGGDRARADLGSARPGPGPARSTRSGTGRSGGGAGRGRRGRRPGRAGRPVGPRGRGAGP